MVTFALSKRGGGAITFVELTRYYQYNLKKVKIENSHSAQIAISFLYLNKPDKTGCITGPGGKVSFCKIFIDLRTCKTIY